VLSPETDDALRAAGLSHLVAVSGMNLMLVMGLAFVLATGGLRLIPGVAGRWPVRILGAVASLAAGLAYGVLTGMSVPAQRALIMGAVFWSGHLLDRQGLSPRSLAAALWVQLALAPHHVLEPGFQMSYAATAALILVFAPAEQRAIPPGPLGKAGRWTGQLIATSLAAGAATAPIAAAHFQSVATLSLLANLAAMPVVSLLATPATGLAALLGLVGLGDLGLWALGHSFDPVIAVATAVAAQPAPLREVGPDPGALALAALLALAVLLAARGLGSRVIALSTAAVCGAACLNAPVPAAILTADGGAYLHSGQGQWLQVQRGQGLPPVPMAASVTRCNRSCQAQPAHTTADLSLSRAAGPDGGWQLAVPGTAPAPTTDRTVCNRAPSPTLSFTNPVLARCGGALIYATPTGLRAVFAPNITRAAPWRGPEPRAPTPQS
jgi:competence protein ComEC